MSPKRNHLTGGKDNLQHIRWNTGHILVSMNLLLKALGAPTEESDEYHRLFGRGESFVKDPAAYPPMARLRDEVFAVHDAAIAAAEKKTDEELDRDLPQETGFAATIMNAGLFLCSHTFYHAGQIAQLRRVLGPRALVRLI